MISKYKSVLIISSLFIITSCGGGGGGGGAVQVIAATISSFVSSISSSEVGDDVTLTWSSANATGCTASGDWSGTKSTSGSEIVTITKPGVNSFSLTCTGEGGSSGARNISIDGYRNITGVTVDGYMSGATIFIDEDANYLQDSGESSTSSGTSGAFTIKFGNGALISLGGQDADTQTQLDDLLMIRSLSGHSTNLFVVSPVTTVATFLEDNSSNINNILGIDTSIDVNTSDPVANKGDGGINDYLYEKGNQLGIMAVSLKNISNRLNESSDTTWEYFKAIAEEANKEYLATSEKVDIEKDTFITNVLDNVISLKELSLSEEAKTRTLKAMSAVIPVISVKSDDDINTAMSRFSFTTLQTDIVKIADGSASSDLVNAYSSNQNIYNYIANDQNISIGDLTSDPIALADAITTDEDVTATINVLANDSYLSSSSVTVSATNGSSGTTSVSNNVITYTPNANYNGSDSFTYTITQGALSSTASVSVTINSVNDLPTIEIASTISAAENQTSVGTVTKADVDDDELTLSLIGTDAASFNLSSDDVITFKTAPDYETKTTYSITLSLSDGTDTVTKDLTIAVTNVNDVAPTITSVATFSAAENQTAIGTVTAVDIEGDVITFSISGSDILITSSGGVLTFASAPDYETKSLYTATVTASDGINSTSQSLSITVTDIFEQIPGYSLPPNIKVIETEE